MKYFAWVLGLFLSGNGVAQECDCTKYPFKPNPPCYGKCVSSLSMAKNADFSKVQGIDPGVELGIKVLAGSKGTKATDFNAIRSKLDLERAALGAMTKGVNVSPSASK